MATQTRKSRRNARTHAGGFVTLSVLIGLVAVFIAAAIGIVRMCDSWLENLPDYESPTAFEVAEPSKVYSADGVLLAQFVSENRTPVTIDQVSPYVLEGTVDTEDVRFYQHKGIDVQGIARAVVMTFTGGREGASTITQQLIRNTILLDEMNDKTIERKVREAYLALQVEKIYSKEDILMMYLNTVNYGAGAYGIEAASQRYFSKSAADLTLAEAATLVGIPQSPTNLNPINNPDNALARRNTVLNRMLSAGDITQEEYDAAKAEPIALSVTDAPENNIYYYPYFVTYVRSLLAENYTDAEVFRGGLTIETSLDSRYQEIAENACWNALDGQDEELEFSLTSIDPSNGHILAMVGGRDYSVNQFNLATQARRQAGSSFKTFTLVTAIKEGVAPYTTIDSSSPAEISEKWTVSNSEGSGYGPISLRSATASSVNTVYARLAHELGAAPIVQTCKDMGITSDLEEVESISLGTQGVCTLEMADAYATLAADGVHHDPVAIVRITDRYGNVIYEAEDTATQALDPEVAWATTDVLMGVISGGTATRARMASGQEAAGKTGTSQNNRDNWFCGYTPQLSTAIWLGHRQEERIRYNGSNGYGGRTCAPVWKAYMDAVWEQMGYENVDFNRYDDPEYDSKWSSIFYVEVEEEEEEEEGEEGAEEGAEQGAEEEYYEDGGGGEEEV